MKKIISISFVTFLLLCFQNCSPYEASLSDQKSLGSEDGSEDGSIDNSEENIPKAWDGKMVDVFMASGHVGRTIMSCDDGKTWINDRSDNPAIKCWVTGDPNYLECDHTPMSGQGIDSGDGWFVANYGWGAPGSIRISRDGVNWETIRTGGSGGGIAYMKGLIFSLWSYWATTEDGGKTWDDVVNSPAAQLGHPSVKRLGDRLFAYGRAGGIRISNDGGKTWIAPSIYQEEWASGFIAEGNGVLISVSHRLIPNTYDYVGYIARSTDGGNTWTGQQVYQAQGKNWFGLVFNGTDFLAYSENEIWQSTDGVTWTKSAPVVIGEGRWGSGPLEFNPATGTYVLITNVWGSYYTDRQNALRSSDGINWTKATFPHGHPLSRITLGKMESRYCP